MAAAYQSSNFFIKLGNTNEVVDHADLSEIEAGTITHKRHIKKNTSAAEQGYTHYSARKTGPWNCIGCLRGSAPMGNRNAGNWVAECR